MKNHFVALVASVILCVCMISKVHAQTQLMRIGNTQELLQQLTPVSDSKLRTAYPILELNVSEKKVLKVETKSKKQSGGQLSVVGGIQNIDHSSFLLCLTESKAEGQIIMKDQREAYRIFSDQNGNVFLKAEDPNQMICLDFHAPSEKTRNKKEELSTSTVAASNVFALQSLPGSPFVAYLDFDGQYFSNTGWAGGGVIDAQPSGMSDADIQAAWEIVSEDYRPFNLNITTDASVFDQTAPGKRIRCVITPTNTAGPGYGGIAYIGSFNWTGYEEPCWAFTSGLGTGGKNVGEACSHEIGHTLYLTHDGRIQPPEAYYAGAGNWAPIMGVGYNKDIVQFSKGEYLNANNTDDDIYIIATQNGFSYRNDDHGNTAADASKLVVAEDGLVSPASNQGIIEKQSDVDAFSFSTAGGIISLTVQPAERFADLDILLKLFNQKNELLTISNPEGLSASIIDTLDAGYYYLTIDGTGYGDPLVDGYTDYGSLGMYSISGLVPPGISNRYPVVSLSSPSSGAVYSAPATVTLVAQASDSDGSIVQVEFFVDNQKLGEDLTSPYEWVMNNVKAGQYSVTVKATDNSGATVESKAVSITVHAVSNTCNVAAWNNAQVYAAPGQQVSYMGMVFENKWWTQNDQPDVNNIWGVWKFVSSCNKGNNSLPLVSFISPLHSSMIEGDALVLAVSASDSDGQIKSVQFYDNGVLLTSLESSPFTLTPATVTVGSHLFKAVATDNQGGVTETTFNLIIDSKPEFVTPLTNTDYPFGGNLKIDIDVKGAQTRVQKVEYFFYGLETKIGEVTNFPYSYTYPSLPNGSSSQGNYLPVLARVTYTNDKSVILNTYIHVVNGQYKDLCQDMETYGASQNYHAGSTVKNNGRIYECKPWPYSGWCNGAAFAYAPGNGSYWQDAWIDKGSCTENAASTSAIDNQPSDVLNLYPNPSSGMLWLKPIAGDQTWGTVECSLYDATGYQVFNNKQFQVNQQTDLSSLSAGMYHVVITSPNQILQYTWIKQ